MVVNDGGTPFSDAARRRATVGEGTAPLANSFWGVSPSKNPNSKVSSFKYYLPS